MLLTILLNTVLMLLGGLLVMTIGAGVDRLLAARAERRRTIEDEAERPHDGGGPPW
jgi:hypothetical protein